MRAEVEFVEILPFTPANRNNLIGWIAGRSDGEHYGTSVVYNFPKTKLVDGPLQIEARIDQNAQLSGQLTLWNQQGSHVRRGTLLVIPIGKALLYAEPIYLQAERSPMPELRLVVLALQDRLAYGPTFEVGLDRTFWWSGVVYNCRCCLTGATPCRCGIHRCAATRGESQLPHYGSLEKLCGLPAPHGGRQVGRGRPETRTVETCNREAELASKIAS